jgi:hypothetical protein
MESGWRKNLTSFFEEFTIVETSKKETLDNFAQFCEFIAEPAFESLSEALREYGIGSKSRITKGKSVAMQINFPGSRIDNFHYAIILPKNSLELKLKLEIKGRKNDGRERRICLYGKRWPRRYPEAKKGRRHSGRHPVLPEICPRGNYRFQIEHPPFILPTDRCLTVSGRRVSPSLVKTRSTDVSLPCPVSLGLLSWPGQRPDRIHRM